MTTASHRLPISIKTSFGVGQIAEGVKNTGFTTFLLFYYNSVLGLSGTYAGTALLVALVFDAVTDPLVGSSSIGSDDGTRSCTPPRFPSQ